MSLEPCVATPVQCLRARSIGFLLPFGRDGRTKLSPMSLGLIFCSFIAYGIFIFLVLSVHTKSLRSIGDEDHRYPFKLLLSRDSNGNKNSYESFENIRRRSTNRLTPQATKTPNTQTSPYDRLLRLFLTFSSLFLFLFRAVRGVTKIFSFMCAGQRRE